MPTQQRSVPILLLTLVAVALLLWGIYAWAFAPNGGVSADTPTGNTGPRPFQPIAADATPTASPSATTATPTPTPTASPPATTATPTPTTETCTSASPGPDPYRRDVRQTNTLSIPRSEHSRAGLTRSRVHVLNTAGDEVECVIEIDESGTVILIFSPPFTGVIQID